MEALFSAIYSRFSHGTMPLFLHSVPVEQALPYCIYYFINSAPAYTFSSVSEGVEVQFSVFASTGAMVMQLMEDIKDLYDDCELSVTGYQFVKMERVLTTSFMEDDGVWQGVISYQVVLHKSL